MKLNKRQITQALKTLVSANEYVEMFLGHADHVAVACISAERAKRTCVSELGFEEWIGVVMVMLATEMLEKQGREPKKCAMRSIEFLDGGALVTYEDRSEVHIKDITPRFDGLSIPSMSQKRLVLSGPPLTAALSFVADLCKRSDSIDDDNVAMRLVDDALSKVISNTLMLSPNIAGALATTEDWDKLVAVYRYVQEREGAYSDVTEVDLTSSLIRFKFKDSDKYIDLESKSLESVDIN